MYRRHSLGTHASWFQSPASKRNANLERYSGRLLCNYQQWSSEQQKWLAWRDQVVNRPYKHCWPTCSGDLLVSESPIEWRPKMGMRTISLRRLQTYFNALKVGRIGYLHTRLTAYAMYHSMISYCRYVSCYASQPSITSLMLLDNLKHASS